MIRNHAAFSWSVTDLLRGDYKRSEYGKVIRLSGDTFAASAPSKNRILGTRPARLAQAWDLLVRNVGGRDV